MSELLPGGHLLRSQGQPLADLLRRVGAAPPEALPQVLKTKYGIPVMTFDVTHFNVHDSVQAEALVTLVSAFLREDEPANARNEAPFTHQHAAH